MRKKSYYKPYGGRRGNLWAIVLVALAAVCVTGFIALQVFIFNIAKTTVDNLKRFFANDPDPNTEVAYRR